MKVRELLERLQAAPPDAIVVIEVEVDEGGGYTDTDTEPISEVDIRPPDAAIPGDPGRVILA